MVGARYGEEVMELQNASGITPPTVHSATYDNGDAPVHFATTDPSPASAKPLVQAIAARRPRRSAFSEILAEIA